MISYETHILPNSDYYVYTPSTLAKKLFFYPICIGSFRYESGYRLARDSYDSFLIMYILKGTCFVTVGSSTYFSGLLCATCLRYRFRFRSSLDTF